MAGTEAELYQRAAYAKLLGATDVQEVESLAQEYWRRHALGWTGSSTAGAMTFSKPLTVSDSLVMSGVFSPSGRVNYRATVAQAADVTLTAADSGKLYRVTSNTTGVTVTLPATTDAVWYGFSLVAQGDTAADFTIKPAAADRIFCTTFVTASTVGGNDEFVKPDTAVNADKDGIFLDANGATAGEGTAGPSIVLVGDGADGWITFSQQGVWRRNTNP